MDTYLPNYISDITDEMTAYGDDDAFLAQRDADLVTL
jgi:hypothetical protein